MKALTFGASAVLVRQSTAHAYVGGDLSEAIEAHGAVEGVPVVVVRPRPVLGEVWQVLGAHQDHLNMYSTYECMFAWIHTSALFFSSLNG